MEYNAQLRAIWTVSFLIMQIDIKFYVLKNRNEERIVSK